MAGAAELKLENAYQAKKFPLSLYIYAAYIHSWKENTKPRFAMLSWSSWTPKERKEVNTQPAPLG